MGVAFTLEAIESPERGVCVFGLEASVLGGKDNERAVHDSGGCVHLDSQPDAGRLSQYPVKGGFSRDHVSAGEIFTSKKRWPH